MRQTTNERRLEGGGRRRRRRGSIRNGEKVGGRTFAGTEKRETIKIKKSKPRTGNKNIRERPGEDGREARQFGIEGNIVKVVRFRQAKTRET
jgi:hypothetical protein